MEVAGRGQRLQLQEKLRILEDLNMLYIRQIAISLQDPELQGKLERELRVREGALKLLAACSRPEQALEAAKGLQLCSARAMALMAELQRRKEAEVLRRRPSDASPSSERLPCRGTVCLSDLRIPLMWKDTEYFRNKGELHRCAVFCLLQLGAEIHDTPMVLVDRTLTDICFETPILFSDAGPDFELKVELYSAGLSGVGGSQGVGGSSSAPRKLATRLSTSLGRSSGKRVRAAMEGGAGSPPGNGGNSPLLLPPHSVPGPKFQLLAHAVLSLAEVQDGFRTHDLIIAPQEQGPCWLPLYGSICCRLVAQPRCMASGTPPGQGTLRHQQAGGAEAQSGPPLFCVLRGTHLLCYRDPRDPDSGLEPTLTITLSKETRVRLWAREGQGPPHGISITNRLGGEDVTHALVAEGREQARSWAEALGQHCFDLAQWKQCCEELMRIEVPPPRRPPPALPRQGSLYHEMAIDPTDDIEAVTDILTRRAGGRAPGNPPWLSLFDGSPPSVPPRPGRVSSPSPPPRRPWGRPRTLSLDAKLSTLKGRGSRRAVPPPRPSPPLSGSSSSGSSSSSPDPKHDPSGPLQSRV
ncbi:rhotekin isoform X2 [Calypte anna]|uniref:rhotekin isoform X2 n=1 Tax=Calypte anna TaxID=9244 RepID=UPI0011C4A91A|nr:rhotekin isoform X2 [Calypte anna]